MPAERMRLLRLTIDDFGLIAHAAVDFSRGLTIFSGETGSGKTMLLGALRFALGDRMETDMIRGGAARARVVLEIEPDAVLRERAAEAGFTLADDDDLIVTRELLATGRSQARINGTAASASQLRALVAVLVDIVGQHDAQRLLGPGFALDIVDRFGGPDSLVVRTEVGRLAAQAHALRAAQTALEADDGRALAQAEFARFAAAEIDDAAIEEAEDDRLRGRREVLANAEKIVTALRTAEAALADDGGVVDALGTAAGALGAIARFGATFAELAAALGALQSEANDTAIRLARERDGVEADPAELEAIVARLESLDRLKRKYGGSLAAVRATRDDFAARIERDETRDERIAACRAELAAVLEQLDAQAAALTAHRRAAAARLETLVGRELVALAMPTARFAVVFEPLAHIGAAGAERAELHLAPNAGEPLRPIAKSASGGELSRVLLALMVAIADRRDRTALVFDEIDAGIGGATAVAVGARIGRLADRTQAIVVTHLAQIASWADAHYALRKDDVRGATIIALHTLLAPHDRLEEIARMLSGDTNPVALEHAATLVAGARSA